MTIKLKWGETPGDKLTREELLREVQRMYSAVESARSVMAMHKAYGDSPFWGHVGSGGQALE